MNAVNAIPAVNIGAIFVSLLLCVGLPIGLAIWLKRKRHAHWKSFFLGCATFLVMVMCLEQMLHGVVLTAAGDFFQNNLLAYALYGGLAAGVFEETGRFFTMKVLMKDSLNRREALMYGVGHGGVEAILIGGIACVTNLVVAILVNAGQLAALLTTGGDQLGTAIGQMASLPGWQFLLVGMERLTAIILHICLSYLVYMAVSRKKLSFFALAIFIHALVDAVTVFLSKSIPILALEIGLLAAVLVFAAVIYRLYRAEPDGI